MKIKKMFLSLAVVGFVGVFMAGTVQALDFEDWSQVWFKLQVKQTLLALRGAELLADLVSKGGGEGGKSTRGGQPRGHGLSQRVRPSVEKVGEQFVGLRRHDRSVLHHHGLHRGRHDRAHPG